MGSNRVPGTPIRNERRAAPRVSSRLHPSLPGLVAFIAGEIEGSGIILDVSVTGAFIHQPSHRLEPGVSVDLYFLEEKSSRRLHGVGEVVRETSSGFAVRFFRLERELRSLVLAAAKKENSP